ncbi:hypothetical protein JAAARDRAFT_57450 [Jaapia argillacea MUCL 33604]|uniref:Uncharacterized protein n=1 Tax=Jaapia argillacea MUCL 33604 TaxID=933084 RepID=A0A067PUM9_9AGAM|nr:hypothetical protein JAAARDRAFT_57450 [Jaapia argillacea MUCL 33604]
MMTDDNGRLEILTVPPHDYGVSIIRRIAHYHLTLQPTSSRFYALTSQLYFCARNDPRVIDADMVNFSRRKNLLKAWCIPENNGGKPFLDLPPLAAEDAEMGKKVAWWNKKLAELGDFKVAVGGHTEFVLTSK